MSDRERNRAETGEFAPEVADKVILSVLRDGDTPVATATEIASEVDMTRQAVTQRLKRLREEGRVERKEVGARAVVWWLTEPTADTESAHEQAFETFADRLTDACGEDIEEIILYGSVARGDHREHSDVDVLIIIEAESARERVQEHASRIGFEVMLEYEALIVETIKTRAEFEAQKDGTYLTAVRRDGQVYA